MGKAETPKFVDLHADIFELDAYESGIVALKPEREIPLEVVAALDIAHAARSAAEVVAMQKLAKQSTLNIGIAGEVMDLEWNIKELPEMARLGVVNYVVNAAVGRDGTELGPEDFEYSLRLVKDESPDAKIFVRPGMDNLPEFLGFLLLRMDMSVHIDSVTTEAQLETIGRFRRDYGFGTSRLTSGIYARHLLDDTSTDIGIDGLQWAINSNLTDTISSGGADFDIDGLVSLSRTEGSGFTDIRLARATYSQPKEIARL